ncbi:hydroxymethylpyrimidine/phosphomethylpyrimidine kinase [Leuconostoc litchii]|uniref:Hydroxymethylpyrimidine/phosphomethylpyrimidine kinase n=1 Tax=Leuconostoc litchii TaxID=1981069 RepID=A0A6P2CMK8_9LACO|nr:bifunctional hydroxymethylpyrimidine kinase/phosphomethylpyrimidine kinase [Leuconostoc litchii]TYC46116.1 bifunctional hydroxymethylpyrimidine kinase/phosphomethylpyrimidine kinase [Leuconostoc litchii]GMA69797.1 hydroxymethylpyrimidine/phosphomethylpyrimidine kinase [Leuconostoc litchii]
MINDFPQVLTIAGSDSDGSAGLQADLHTFFIRNTYGMSVLVAAVAGNSYGIHAAETLPLEFIEKQFEVLADDFHIRASKTGMLSDDKLIETVVKAYQKYNFGPLVVDPVITTKHGAQLLKESAFKALKEQLLPLATVATPNFFEAQLLTGRVIDSEQQQVAAAKDIQALGVQNVIVKGWHNQENQNEVADYVLLADGTEFWLRHPYFITTHINGTGDTLSATIAAEISKGQDIATAIRIAHDITTTAIAHEIAVGHKFGPINHWAAQTYKQKEDN